MDAGGGPLSRMFRVCLVVSALAYIGLEELTGAAGGDDAGSFLSNSVVLRFGLGGGKTLPLVASHLPSPSAGPKERVDFAVCYFGLTRTARITYVTHQENILKPLRESGLSFDVFMHTWLVEDGHDALKGMPSQELDDYMLFDVTHYAIDEQAPFRDWLDQNLYLFWNETGGAVRGGGGPPGVDGGEQGRVAPIRRPQRRLRPRIAEAGHQGCALVA